MNHKSDIEIVQGFCWEKKIPVFYQAPGQAWKEISTGKQIAKKVKGNYRMLAGFVRTKASSFVILN